LLFGHHKKKSCCNSCCAPACDSCGCGAGGCGAGYSAPQGAPAPAMDDSAPVPPAPMVDPAAYRPAQRRVVHAGVNLLR
jgi:hypothetical protein